MTTTGDSSVVLLPEAARSLPSAAEPAAAAPGGRGPRAVRGSRSVGGGTVALPHAKERLRTAPVTNASQPPGQPPSARPLSVGEAPRAGALPFQNRNKGGCASPVPPAVAPLPPHLAPEPQPAVEQPERHRDGVHDHLPFSPLFVFLLQQLQTAIKFDYLKTNESFQYFFRSISRKPDFVGASEQPRKIIVSARWIPNP